MNYRLTVAQSRAMARAPTTPASFETRVGDVHDLRAFALACDLRSLTAAARVTAESKATLSRRITRLEAALGAALVQRSSRGIEPTEIGLAYRARIGEVLGLLGDANAAASNGGRATLTGPLRISIPPGFSGALAPVLAGFAAAHPQVVLVVHLSSRFGDLEAEHFDVALRATAALPDSSLVALRVGGPQSDGVLVAAPTYARSHRMPRRSGELADHRILVLADTGGAFTLPLARTGSREIRNHIVPIALAGSDLGFLKEMALAGAGIAILPWLSVQRELDTGELIRVLPGYCWPSAGLFLIHRGGRFVAPKIRGFLDYVRDALRAPPAK